MKFIFPKNYKYNAKILGFIDYTTAVIDLIIGVILFLIINLIFKSISTQISVFISLFLPVVLLSVFGTNGENIIYYFIYVVKFIKNRKVYFYTKKELKEENKENTFIKYYRKFFYKIIK